MVLVERKKETDQKPKGLLIPLVRVDLERKREEYDQKELIFIKHIIQFIEVTNFMPYLFCK
jgi:hypothetical protein